eukprot:XP_001696924.1 predicted protein [Chlamydomonas reinhardtii]
MLAQALGPGVDPETYLTGREPHRVQFPNHRSAASSPTHAAFIDREWDPSWGPPTVTNSLRVVEGKKLRLFMNPMYPNLFMEIPTLKYESVLNLPTFLRNGNFMFTPDHKSGYWNLLLHPSMYRA